MRVGCGARSKRESERQALGIYSLNGLQITHRLQPLDPKATLMAVASAHPAIIDGHSGIFSGPFIDFLTSYIGFIEGKEYQLTVEGRQSKHTSPQEH